MLNLSCDRVDAFPKEDGTVVRYANDELKHAANTKSPCTAALWKRCQSDWHSNRNNSNKKLSIPSRCSGHQPFAH